MEGLPSPISAGYSMQVNEPDAIQMNQTELYKPPVFDTDAFNNHQIALSQIRLARDKFEYDKHKAQTDQAATNAALNLGEIWQNDVPEIDAMVADFRKTIDLHPEYLDPTTGGITNFNALMEKKRKIEEAAAISKARKTKWDADAKYSIQTDGWNSPANQAILDARKKSKIVDAWDELTPPDKYSQPDLIKGVTEVLGDAETVDNTYTDKSGNIISTKTTRVPYGKIEPSIEAFLNSPDGDVAKLNYEEMRRTTPSVQIPIYPVDKKDLKFDPVTGLPVPMGYVPVTDATDAQIAASQYIPTQYKQAFTQTTGINRAPQDTTKPKLSADYQSGIGVPYNDVRNGKNDVRNIQTVGGWDLSKTGSAPSNINIKAPTEAYDVNGNKLLTPNDYGANSWNGVDILGVYDMNTTASGNFYFQNAPSDAKKKRMVLVKREEKEISPSNGQEVPVTKNYLIPYDDSMQQYLQNSGIQLNAGSTTTQGTTTKTNYSFNGKTFTKQQIESAAKQAGVSFDDYIKQYGIQ